MASWDGSYYGPEDPNFYAYSSQGRNWGYYPQNGSNPATNVPSFNQEAYVNDQATAQQYNRQQQQQQQPFFENNRSPNLPPFKCKSGGNGGDRSKRKSYQGKLPFGQQIDPSIVENSNLHATAGEFIPNSFKAVQETGGEPQPQVSEYVQEAGTSRAYFSDNRKGRDKKEKKYEGKKETYKPRDSQDSQYQSNNSYKNTARNQTPRNRRFQNDPRYPNTTRQYQDNGRNYGDKDSDRKKWPGARENIENGPQPGDEDAVQASDAVPNKYYKNSSYDNPAARNSRHDSVRQSGVAPKHYSGDNHSNHNPEGVDHNSGTSKNVRRYFNEDRGERYRDRRSERYVDRYEQTGAREKKTSYSDYNGYKNNNYEREERKEKVKDKDPRDAENWRNKNGEDGKGVAIKRPTTTTTIKRPEKGD